MESFIALCWNEKELSDKASKGGRASLPVSSLVYYVCLVWPSKVAAYVLKIFERFKLPGKYNVKMVCYKYIENGVGETDF